MIKFLQERIWVHLPKSVPLKMRSIAAVLWCLALPALYWLIKHRSDEGAAALLGRILAWGAAAGVLLLLPVIGEHIYLNILRVLSVVGFVLSNVILSLVFFLMVTPMAYFFRLKGKDFLDLKFKRGSAPAWQAHQTHADPRRYYRMF